MRMCIKATLLGLAATLGAAPDGRAAVVYLNADAVARADAGFDRRNDTLNGATLGQFPTSRTITASEAGVSSDAMLSANVRFDETTGELSGSSNGVANASASAVNPGDDRSTSLSQAALHLDFEVLGSGATITVSGTLNTSGDEGFGDYLLQNLDTGVVVHFRATASPFDEFPFTNTFSDTQFLPAGTYRATFSNSGSVAQQPDNGQSFHGDHQVDFIIVPEEIDIPENILFWEQQDGDFSFDENWEPAQSPGPNDTVIFDREANYSVFFGTETAGRFIVERGLVAFEGSSFGVGNGTPETPSAIVGNSTSDMASLFLEGIELNTLHSAIGLNSGTTAAVYVLSGSAWTDAGATRIGVEGQAVLEISEASTVTSATTEVGVAPNGSGMVTIIGPGIDGKGGMPEWSTGNLAIGLRGTASLNANSGKILSDAVVIGAEPGAFGDATADSGTDWTFEGDLVVGNGGTGSLTIWGSSGVGSESNADILLGVEPGAEGFVSLAEYISFLGTMGNVQIGVGGTGDVSVEDGALLVASEILIALEQGSEGVLEIQGIAEGESSQLQTGFLVVGNLGHGVFRLEDGAEALTANSSLGEGADSFGEAIVDNALWTVSEGLFVGSTVFEQPDQILSTGTVTLMNDGEITAGTVEVANGSSILGSGTLTTPSLLVEGEIAPGVSSGTPSKGETDERLGALRFDGDTTFDSARLTIEASSDNTFDRIEISGDASIANAVIEFVFLDGYLPQTGDELAFLTAANITMDANTTFTYSGAADGFEFDVMNLGGMLMFQAQNNAQSERGEGEGESEGDTEGSGEQPRGGCPAAASERVRPSFADTQFDGIMLLLVLAVLIRPPSRISPTKRMEVHR